MSENTCKIIPVKMDPLLKTLIIVFVALMSFSMVVLKDFEVRPFYYYLLVAAMALIVFFEIVLFRQDARRSYFILPQIMLLGLSYIWGMTLKYFYYVGRTDILGHAWYAQSLLDTGKITAIFDLYQAFPLWHILTSSILMIGGMPVEINQIMFMACGLIFFIMPVAVYMVALRLLGNEEIALLSALILALNTDVLIFGMYSIPRSIVSFLFVVLLLILLRSRITGKTDSLRRFLPALLLILIITMYHTVSILFILVLLTLIYVLQKLFIHDASRPLITMKFLVVSTVIAMCYWAIFAQNLLWTVVETIVSPASSVPINSIIASAPIYEVFNYLQYSPLLLFIILGVLVALRTKKCSNDVRLLSTAALLFIPLSFPGPLLLISKFSDNFDMVRFIECTFIFMGIAGAVGLAAMYFRPNRALKAICVVLFIAMILLSISNDFVASDNPLMKRNFYTSYLTQSEITGIEHISLITKASGGYALTDYVAGRYLEFSTYAAREEGELVTAEIYKPDNILVTNSSRDVILIRDGELEKRPLKMYPLREPEFTTSLDGKLLAYYTRDDPTFANLDRLSMVYDSDSVHGYN